jgi:hypothetical protein
VGCAVHSVTKSLSATAARLRSVCVCVLYRQG